MARLQRQRQKQAAGMWLMLALQTAACSLVTFLCRRSGLRQLKVLEIDALPLQEMHSGSFALLSNRVNELKLPTICSSPKESATDKRSLCNGWRCRDAALHRGFCSVWWSSGTDGSSNLGQALTERMCAVVYALSIPICSRRRPHYSSSCVA